MTVKVRYATHEDVGALVALGRQMHAESPNWSRFPYSGERTAATLRALIEGNGVVLVAERAGAIVGGAAAVVAPHPLLEITVAHELWLYIEPAHRGGSPAMRLVNAMRAEVQRKGAQLFQVGISTGVDPERTAQMYERLGFKRSGQSLAVRLCPGLTWGVCGARVTVLAPEQVAERAQ